jgi:DNA-directed RNA polymerase specialized sigma24 family protein
VEDAEDPIGTDFEQAYAPRAQFDPTGGAFSTWLFRIEHNELVGHYRKTRVARIGKMEKEAAL